MLRRLLRRWAMPSAATALGRYGHVTDRVVVVDTETTGLYNQDRVVEVAAVTLGLDGEVVDEWETLVNPGRDVGPTWLHGITASMVADAPTFDAVAGELAARTHGAIVCAHNLPFDARMLINEYARLGVEVTFTPGLDTLAATGCKLSVACEMAGIRLEGAHRALVDARATAQLLLAVARHLDGASPTVFHAPVRSAGLAQCVSRAAWEPVAVAPPTYLAALAARVVHSVDEAAVASYLDLLDRAMADLHLDAHEKQALHALAVDLGLDESTIALANRRWMDDLIAEAAADGVVDGEEFDQLLMAAHVLGLDADRVRERTVTQRTESVPLVLQPGMRVCFTGEVIDADGVPIPREEMEDVARRLGLDVEETFTKSRCQLLVAADVSTTSGKAGKARRWGIPIVAAADFLNADPGGTVTAYGVAVGGSEAVTCSKCGRAFARKATRSRKPACCPSCR